MATKLSGKVAVITGGTMGIGLATAKRFVDEGAHVYITGRRQDRLDAAVTALGANVTGVRGDVSRLADLDDLFTLVRQRHDRIDILFANAGGGTFVPLGEITEEHYAATFDRNVKGTLFTVQKALPLLGEGASIILAGSSTGTSGTRAFSVYSASKAAIRNFARSWILDLKARKVRVNVVSPGPVETPGLTAQLPADELGRQIKASLAADTPLGRIGDPDDVARAVVFLASDDASFINGIELSIDGGMAQI